MTPYNETPEANKNVNIPDAEAKKVDELMNEVVGLAKARVRHDARTYVNGAFMDGDHFAQFNRTTGRLERERAPQGTVNRIIQKGQKKMVEMKNTILSDDPRWQVHPEPDGKNGEFSQQALNDATNISDWLQDIFSRKDVKKKRDDTVFNATWQPYTVMGASYDEHRDSYEVAAYEFFEALCDPHVYDIQESGKFVLQSMRPAKSIRNNPDYSNTDGMKIEKRWAASEWQNDRLREKYGSDITVADPVRVYEIYEKVEVTKESRKQVKALDTKDKKNNWIDDKQDHDIILYFCTIAGGRLVREVYLPYHMYPFVSYHINDGLLLGPAPVERIISANKSLDVQQSRKEQYVNEVVAGRVWKHKTTKIHRMTNSNGSVMEWEGEPSLKPEVMPVPDLPSITQSVAMDTERFISDLSVTGSDMIHLIRGSGGRGAQMIEALKGMDVSAMSTARNNLALAMEQLSRILFMLADWHQATVQGVSHSAPDGSPNHFQVIGRRYANTDLFKAAYPKDDNTKIPTVISSDQKVTVSIESGMAYTQEGKWTILQNLISMGAISVQSALTMLKVSGNVSQELRQMMLESGQTMINTQDFKALPPEQQDQILQWLQQANITMPVQPKQSIGSVKKVGPSANRS